MRDICREELLHYDACRSRWGGKDLVSVQLSCVHREPTGFTHFQYTFEKDGGGRHSLK